MSDEEMIEYISRCALDSNAPRPSIETLLHAFLPAAHIDHTHPDSVIALTAIPTALELVTRVFGDEALWIPWKRPGFALAKDIAVAVAEQPAVRAVLLEKHGLITWGETSDETYDSTLEFAKRAADALREVSAEHVPLGGEAVSLVSDEAADSLLAVTLPALRGALLADREGAVLEVDRSDEARFFASSRRGPAVSQIGSPCPDHLINTKHKPLAIEFDPAGEDAEALATKLRDGVEGYADWYREYYEHNMTDESREFAIDPAGPRVVIIPGVGIVTCGADAGKARFSRDLYRRAIAVESAADAAGGFGSLTEQEAFEIEYWPLERYKLAQAPAWGRACGQDRAGHGWCKRYRPCGGTSARRARGACSGCRLERRRSRSCCGRDRR